ncbi:O-antigen ligase family protein [Nocardioides daeguensis]|uniref:O-antigen ligase-related domain-containing protein n=1 Tax=Nocardioides daeguensis TaxID=908359 RepID=A0ABP6VBF2_9ACTN|nr:O-antigen ligase family protein [Nocardioides daeguensis]MBV6726174.1 O-antigen ligase family protein [Nocardioides daeguensis]MCR1772017.1 O-antigen ligase family protein [Nocardioides daeguensis]
MITALVFAALVGMAALSIPRRLRAAVPVVIPLVVIVAAPHILTDGGRTRHVGISTAQPAIATWLVALLLMTGLFVLSGRVRGAVLVLPVFVWMLVAFSIAWPSTPEVVSGLMHVASGLVAWIVGCSAAAGLAVDDRARAFVGRVALLLLLLELGVVALQALGYAINPMAPAQAALLEGRFNGTISHPNDLGKIVLLLLATFFMTAVHGSSGLRRPHVFLAAGVALMVAVMTGGRAVIIGVIAFVAFWALLQIPEVFSRAKKMAMIGIVMLGIAGSFGVVAARFAEDPSGGARSQLTPVAHRAIRNAPWFGVGPNSYVETVGQTDQLTASGVPVHSTYLLAAAELGIAGSVLLAVPLLVLVMRALGARRKAGPQGAASTAVLALAPVILMIGWTGWGLLGSSVFPAWFLVAGLGYGLITRPSSGDSAQRQSAGSAGGAPKLSAKRRAAIAGDEIGSVRAMEAARSTMRRGSPGT